LNFANQEGLESTIRFRKPLHDDGVDIEYMVPGGAVVHVQITTAYPLWFDVSGNALNGGHQQRLQMEKLTAHCYLLIQSRRSCSRALPVARLHIEPRNFRALQIFWLGWIGDVRGRCAR
jgi:hypothetical protein